MDLCGECAGWPLCDDCHLYRVAVPGVCESCQHQPRHAPVPEGVCAGYDGTGCGTPVMDVGPYGFLCGRCEVRAHRKRTRADADWDAARAAAVETARAQEAGAI